MPELDQQGLLSRVFYARGLSRLEQHLLSKFAPLSDTDRDELWSAVDRNELDERMTGALFSASVDPRSAALPLDTRSATVVACVRASDAVRFTEAARRGAGAWTARYACKVDATVEVTRKSGDVAEEEKKLILAGRIDLDSDSHVIEFTIESINGEDDDPQRRAWARSDASAQLSQAVIRGLSSVMSTPSFRDQLDSLVVSPSFRDQLDSLVISPSFRDQLDNLVISPSFRDQLDNLKVGLNLREQLGPPSRPDHSAPRPNSDDAPEDDTDTTQNQNKADD